MNDKVEPRDLSDTKQFEASRKKASDRDAIKRDSLRYFLGTEAGRMVVYDWIVLASPYHSPFSRDPVQMAHNVGEQNITRQIMASAEAAAPELYLLMIKENQSG